MMTLFDEETIMKGVLAEKDREREEALEEGKRLGLAEGEKRGEARGLVEGKIAMIKRMMQSLSLSAEKVLEMLAIPKSEWNAYIPKLS